MHLSAVRRVYGVSVRRVGGGSDNVPDANAGLRDRPGRRALMWKFAPN